MRDEDFAALQQSINAAHARIIQLTTRQMASEIILVGYLGKIPEMSRDKIMAEIEELAKQLHHKALIAVENQNPSVAALLDQRAPEEISETDESPSGAS